MNKYEYIKTPVIEKVAQVYILAWWEYTASIGIDINIRHKYRAPRFPKIRWPTKYAKQSVASTPTTENDLKDIVDNPNIPVYILNPR